MAEKTFFKLPIKKEPKIIRVNNLLCSIGDNTTLSINSRHFLDELSISFDEGSQDFREINLIFKDDTYSKLFHDFFTDLSRYQKEKLIPQESRSYYEVSGNKITIFYKPDIDISITVNNPDPYKDLM
ncbi:MAG TPA: hypothetical protein VGE24_03910 [Emticicia sp.]